MISFAKRELMTELGISHLGWTELTTFNQEVLKPHYKPGDSSPPDPG